MQFQNISAVERKISEINPEADSKVRVIGTVISKAENSFILDDGKGTVQVFADTKVLEAIAENKVIRVIGRVSPNEKSFDIRAEIIHDMAGLNTKIHDTVQKLWKEY